MFASLVKESVQIGENTVIVRKLSASSLDKAIEQNQISTALVTQRLGAEMIKAYQDRAAAMPKDENKPLDPNAKHASYDRFTVLMAGIHSWSGPDCKEDPNAKTIGDLDEETANLLFHKILTMSLAVTSPADPKD